MPVLLVRHGVRDYAHWRRLFDEDAGSQREAGMHVHGVWRDAADPRQVVFLFDIDDRARAEAFMARPGGEEMVERAGVEPPFEVRWLTD